MLDLKNKNKKIDDCSKTNCLEEIKLSEIDISKISNELDKILEKMKNRKVKL